MMRARSVGRIRLALPVEPAARSEAFHFDTNPAKGRFIRDAVPTLWRERGFVRNTVTTDIFPSLPDESSGYRLQVVVSQFVRFAEILSTEIKPFLGTKRNHRLHTNFFADLCLQFVTLGDSTHKTIEVLFAHGFSLVLCLYERAFQGGFRDLSLVLIMGGRRGGCQVSEQFRWVLGGDLGEIVHLVAAGHARGDQSFVGLEGTSGGKKASFTDLL